MSQLYALRGTETGKVKIGITDNFEARLPSYRTHCSEPIEVLTVTDIGGPRSAAESVETHLLSRWSKQKSHGEWVVPTASILNTIYSLPRIYGGWGTGIQWTKGDHQQRNAIKVMIHAQDGGGCNLLIGGNVVAKFSHGAIALVVMRSVGEALRAEYALEKDGSGVKSALPDVEPPGDYDNTVPDESGAWAI